MNMSYKSCVQACCESKRGKPSVPLCTLEISWETIGLMEWIWHHSTELNSQLKINLQNIYCCCWYLEGKCPLILASQHSCVYYYFK